ncbi:AAA family ATPase [Bacillus sp. AFS017274]|uniref:AAA family ATPase n=1 Tax=Bacillus sp. AFS017274 TaxID=2033488 RepID=UPI0015CF614A|nr:AAA family ATPase [Bacillus sp. AFS017274]
MKLKWIELKNFKQYYGKQCVKFAGAEDDGIENVTIVYGENGKGKTTLYRAVIYAIHGDKTLERDEEISKRKKMNDEILHIGNLAALEEDGFVDVYVMLGYEFNGRQYEVKRSMTSIKDGMQIEEADLLHETYLKETDEYGRTHIYDDIEEINARTSQALNKKMRQYFLFDGEQIEEMTKSNLEQRTQVREGLKKLLGIDSLYKAIEVANGVRKHYQNQIKSTAKGDYKVALHELETIESSLQATKQQIEQLELDIEQLTQDKSDIDSYLEANKTVRENVKQREALEEELRKVQVNSVKLKEMIRKFGSKSILIPADRMLQAAEFDIEAERSNLGQSYNISTNLLREFIESNHCGICGTEAPENSTVYVNILNVLDNINDSDYREALNELMKNTAVVQGKSEDTKQELFNLREEAVIATRETEKLTTAIQELDVEIGLSGDNEAVAKEFARENIMQRIVENTVKLNQAKEKVVQLRDINATQKRKCEEFQKQENSQNVFEDYKQVAEKTWNELTAIQETFTKEMASKVSTVATRIFKQLLDEDSKMNFKGVIVKEDFSLDVQSFSNYDFLSNISSGQRHILSISFILALLEISEGADGQLKTPLFMDTPFGRISGDNRDNLLSIIPQKAAQWVLLVTDTEFTNAEVKALRPTKRWGKVYTIKLEGPGRAIIEEGNVDTFVAKR